MTAVLSALDGLQLGVVEALELLGERIGLFLFVGRIEILLVQLIVPAIELLLDDLLVLAPHLLLLLRQFELLAHLVLHGWIVVLPVEVEVALHVVQG